MVDAYPLSWPVGWPRNTHRQKSNFGSHTPQSGSRLIHNQLRLMGATNIIISCNGQVSSTGAVVTTGKISDPGVAVYFIHKASGKETCVPCDRWDRLEHNLWAVGKTIESMRSIERWGAKEMVDAAFRGFVALPAPPDYSFEKRSIDELRELLRQYHPDTSETPDTDKYQAVLGEIRKRK